MNNDQQQLEQLERDMIRWSVEAIEIRARALIEQGYDRSHAFRIAEEEYENDHQAD